MKKDNYVESVEAELATTKNLKIAETYAKEASAFAAGILLTGSNAWGAFYAVKSTSDVDLVVIAEEVGKLDKIIQNYIAKGLLEPYEKERFDAYAKFYAQKRADQFSVIAKHLNTNVSIDFITMEIVRKICDLSPIRSVAYNDGQVSIDIRFVKEFRVNPPKEKGYSLDDLKGKRTILYHAAFEEIKNEQGKILGYLSDTLVDGQSVENETYFLGVISFFLGIYPVILLDKDEQLAKAINILHSNIRKIMKGKVPAYITRQERMPPDLLRQIKDKLIG